MLAVAPPGFGGERGGVAGEVGLAQVAMGSPMVAGAGDAHPRRGLAVWTEGTPCVDCDVFKSAVLLVVIERAGGRVVGHINFRPAVVVKVGRQDPQTVGAIGA